MPKSILDDPQLAPFYDLIGRIVIVWSRIERQVDFSLAASRSYDRDLQRADAPVSWSKKFPIFRRVCRRHPKTRHLSWLDPLFYDMATAATDRHTLIHGYCHGTVPGEIPRIRFRSARYNRDETSGREFRASINEMVEFLRRLRLIDQRLGLLTLAFALARHTRPDAVE